MTTYNTGDVAGLTGLSSQQIRRLARDGVLGIKTKHEYRYQFPDLLLGKTAQRLLHGGATFADVCRALKAIRKCASQKIPATAVAVRTAGREVIVAEEGIVWNPATGQVQLDFVSASEAPSRREPAVQDIDSSDAEDWFDRGCASEAEQEYDQAMSAYEHALRLDPEHVDARINKGRIEALRGDVEGAEQDYRTALRHDTGNAVGWFNLGVLFDDLGRYDDAVASYRKSIDADPVFPDAHFNLALLCEKKDPVLALRHLKDYQKIIER